MIEETWSLDLKVEFYLCIEVTVFRDPKEEFGGRSFSKCVILTLKLVYEALPLHES